MTLADEISKVSLLHGSFVLRSGLQAAEYFDKYQFEANPELLAKIAERMLRLIPPDTEVLAGLELGGVPIAVALGLKTGLHTCFVRKQRKAYGTCRIVEGVAVKDRKVCLIEDVIASGGQVVESVKALRSEGAVISTVCCVILRSGQVPEILKTDGLHLAPLFRVDGEQRLVEA